VADLTRRRAIGAGPERDSVRRITDPDPFGMDDFNAFIRIEPLGAGQERVRDIESDTQEQQECELAHDQ